MTPRLRILSIGLALSLTYSIYDYIDRNSNKKPVIEKKKVVKKRPSTARVSLTRAENLKRKVRERSDKKDKKDKKDKIIPQEDFLPISDDISMLEGWSRNPFVEVYKPPSISQKITDQTITDQTIVEEPVFTTLDGLNIETAVRMGDKAYVTINGQTFTEGDLINNILIERIENQKITFRVGKTRIIKDVGT
ncbi:MAG TPA: hypothetical protein EYO18_00500 [Candidatus Marinimicrobia bacterium]|jgi:hypothetical protein|nr:hypothetical protein [Candidatus Neomarinimicrobiota bacterium]